MFRAMATPHVIRNGSGSINMPPVQAYTLYQSDTQAVLLTVHCAVCMCAKLKVYRTTELRIYMSVLSSEYAVCAVTVCALTDWSCDQYRQTD